MTWTPEQLELWIGRTAVDRKGNRIGKITDVYADDATGLPEWIAITTGLFGTRISFAPTEGATEKIDTIEVAVEKSIVKDSPNIEADGSLSEEEERRLYRHYGKVYSEHDPDGEGPEPVVQLDEAGSASVTDEMSPATARARLEHSDKAAVEFIDLDGQDENVDSPVDSKN